MSYRLRRNAKLVAQITILSGLAGTLLSTWQGYSAGGGISIWNVGNGLVDGSIVAFLLSAYTFLLAEVALKRPLARLGFGARLAINSSAYVVLIIFGRALGRYLMQYEKLILFPMSTPTEQLHLTQALGAAAIASVVLNFLFQNSRLLGPRVLASFVTGRYHVPVRESRIMMFMDLTSSTTIAERIGDVQFLRFLDAVFAEFTEPILATQAEIYKYVGDEIILSWPEAVGIREANCIRLFQLVSAAIAARSPHFRRDFGVTPRFRAGLHVGSVVVGEMGDLKQEIVYVGDLMNTTARIAAHTRTAGHDFIASADLIKRLQLPGGTKADTIGRVRLRGKEQPVELAAISL